MKRLIAVRSTKKVFEHNTEVSEKKEMKIGDVRVKTQRTFPYREGRAKNWSFLMFGDEDDQFIELGEYPLKKSIKALLKQEQESD